MEKKPQRGVYLVLYLIFFVYCALRTISKRFLELRLKSWNSIYRFSPQSMSKMSNNSFNFFHYKFCWRSIEWLICVLRLIFSEIFDHFVRITVVTGVFIKKKVSAHFWPLSVIRLLFTRFCELNCVYNVHFSFSAHWTVLKYSVNRLKDDFIIILMKWKPFIGIDLYLAHAVQNKLHGSYAHCFYCSWLNFIWIHRNENEPIQLIQLNSDLGSGVISPKQANDVVSNVNNYYYY